jgi:hypothetical protein
MEKASDGPRQRPTLPVGVGVSPSYVRKPATVHVDTTSRHACARHISASL